MPVVEKSVEIKTPDGTCDAVFIHPSTGSHPGVLIWPDAFGLRPSTARHRQTARGGGLFGPRPQPVLPRRQGAGDRGSIDVQLLEPDRSRQAAAADGIGERRGRAEKDAAAYIAFLDAQPQVNTAKKVGTQGYCMGGPLVVRTAAAVPNRVGAGASFHGGGLVTANPDSPHLLAPKIKARMYFGIASNDDKSQPDAKDKLREAFAAANVPAEIEVYRIAARLVHPGYAEGRRRHADLQQAGRRESVGEAGRALQSGARLNGGAARAAPASGARAAGGR